jgi:hypothetical protein
MAACTVGQIVQIYMPKTKNGAYSVQQAIQMKLSTKTIEIAYFIILPLDPTVLSLLSLPSVTVTFFNINAYRVNEGKICLKKLYYYLFLSLHLFFFPDASLIKIMEQK